MQRPLAAGRLSQVLRLLVWLAPVFGTSGPQILVSFVSLALFAERQIADIAQRPLSLFALVLAR